MRSTIPDLITILFIKATIFYSIAYHFVAMKKSIAIMVIIAMTLVGMAGAEMISLAGMNWSEAKNLTGGEDLLSSDMPGIPSDLVKILDDNPDEYKGLGGESLKLGSMTGYNRTEFCANQIFYTPKELATRLNSSTRLEFP